MPSPERQKAAQLAPDYGMAGTFRAVTRLTVMLLWIFINIPIQVFFRVLMLPPRITFPHIWHRFNTQHILHMKIEVMGTPTKQRPVLFLSNHLSYVDIITLSAVLPVSFVSRAEVANWPLLGLLGKLQDTVFVERRARAKTKEQNKQLQEFLAQGRALVLFPEGTSTDGTQVLPFKSALLQAVLDIGSDATVQPVTLACMNNDGSQHLYPWYGDMDFPEHVWPFLKAPGYTMRVTFHDPVPASQFEDRKQLAQYAHDAVTKAPFGVNA